MASELFRRDLIAWLYHMDPDGDYSDDAARAQGMKPLTTAGAIAIAVTWARDEILFDVHAGIVPRTVRGFADLHDFVDANGYGGAFHWGDAALSENHDDVYGDDLCHFWNAVQNELDGWIKTGALLEHNN